MILDYLRRVGHLRLFGSVSIAPQNRDPPIAWNTDYEKQWRDECTRRLTVSKDDSTNDLECYETPPAQPATIDSSDEEGLRTQSATHGIELARPTCINASKPCIYVQPTAYQRQQCDQAVIGTQSAVLFNTKNQFERLLNILSHPDSEVVRDNESLSPVEKVRQSGKTAFLFELLKRVASLGEDLDIAIMTDDHDMESVVYRMLRYHGYQCQRIPVILEDNWSNEHGVFFTTSEASYTKWSTRPSIDVVFMFDIRVNNDILSKVDGDKRIMWIINKNTVEERAFSILQHESDAWQDVWRRNEGLRNAMAVPNTWDESLSFDESTQKSADQALDFLFPSNKRPRSLHSDTLDIPPPKRRPSIIILDDSSDDDHISLVESDELSESQPPEPSPTDVNHPESRTTEVIDEQPVSQSPEPPAPLDVNHFEVRTMEVIDQLLDFPRVLNLGRKNKEVAKAAMLSRELKDTVTATEKALYTSLQPRLEDIEARFQCDYNELTDNLQRQYVEWMSMYQRKYRKEALDALDIAVASRDKQQPQLD